MQDQLCSVSCLFMSAERGDLVTAPTSQSLGGLAPSPTWWDGHSVPEMAQ